MGHDSESVILDANGEKDVEQDNEFAIRDATETKTQGRIANLSSKTRQR